MALLGLLWLVLIIIDLTTGLSSLLQTISTGIWVLFVLDFGLKFTLAPQKIPFLWANVITLISLAIPALRFVRLARSLTLLRSVRAMRGVRLVRLIGSANRGLRSLSRSFGRRGFGYVLLTTLLVTLLGRYVRLREQGSRRLQKLRRSGLMDAHTAVVAGQRLLAAFGGGAYSVLSAFALRAGGVRLFHGFISHLFCGQRCRSRGYTCGWQSTD